MSEDFRELLRQVASLPKGDLLGAKAQLGRAFRDTRHRPPLRALRLPRQQGPRLEPQHRQHAAKNPAARPPQLAHHRARQRIQPIAARFREASHPLARARPHPGQAAQRRGDGGVGHAEVGGQFAQGAHVGFGLRLAAAVTRRCGRKTRSLPTGEARGTPAGALPINHPRRRNRRRGKAGRRAYSWETWTRRNFRAAPPMGAVKRISCTAPSFESTSSLPAALAHPSADRSALSCTVKVRSLAARARR